MYRLFFFLWVCFLFQGTLRSQPRNDSRLFHTYSTKEGMVMNSVYSITASSSGKLWIGSPGGLQLFDGYNFEPWETPDAKNQPPLAIYHSLEDRKGNVWVSNTSGAYVFKKGSKIPVKLQTPAGPVSGETFHYLIPLCEKDGIMWFIDDQKKISGFSTTTFREEKTVDLAPYGWTNRDVYTIISTCVSTDPSGTAYISGMDNGKNFVIRFQPGKDPVVVRFSTAGRGMVKGVIPVNDSTLLYAATGMTWLSKGLDWEHPIKVLSRQNIPGNHNRRFTWERLSVFNKGNILFPGNEGIYEFNQSDSSLRSYSINRFTTETLSRQLVFALKEDQQGNIWIGKDAGDGMLVYYPSKLRFQLLQAPAQYFNLVYSLALGPQQQVYAGNFEKGVNVFNRNGEFLHHIPLPYTENNLPVSVRCMTLIDPHHLLMKTLYGKLIICDLRTQTTRDLSHLIPKQVVANPNSFDANFVQEDSGRFLFVHSTYLLRFEMRQRQYTVSVVDSLTVQEKLTAVAKDRNGALILGSSNGCLIRDPGSKGSAFISLPASVKHIAVAPDNTLWVATIRGIYLIRNKVLVQSYTTANGLLNDFIYGILFDKAGNAWFSSNRGLGCIRPNGTISLYSEEDGIQGEEFDTQSFVAANDGTLYFGGVKGITGFLPEDVLKEHPQGQMLFSGLYINGVNYSDARRSPDELQWELPHDSSTVTFEYSLSDFSDPSSNSYQLRIEGSDPDWVNLKNAHSFRNSFQPGHYTVLIRGSSDGSTWSEPLTLRIHILPSLWQSWQFRVLAVLLLASLVLLASWLYNRNKIRKKIKEMEMRQEIQKERERISRDLHDNIGAYTSAMIAQIDTLKRNSNNNLQAELEPLKEDARQILGALRETIWVLKKEQMLFTEFADGFKQFATKLLRNSSAFNISFQEEIINDRHLNPADTLNLYRILQEALQNTVKHSGARQVHILFSSTDKIRIHYSDDGKGFDAEGISAGEGLENMQYRAAEAGFDLRLESHAGKGAQIHLTEK